MKSSILLKLVLVINRMVTVKLQQVDNCIDQLDLVVVADYPSFIVSRESILFDIFAPSLQYMTPVLESGQLALSVLAYLDSEFLPNILFNFNQFTSTQPDTVPRSLEMLQNEILMNDVAKFQDIEKISNFVQNHIIQEDIGNLVENEDLVVDTVQVLNIAKAVLLTNTTGARSMAQKIIIVINSQQSEQTNADDSSGFGAVNGTSYGPLDDTVTGDASSIQVIILDVNGKPVDQGLLQAIENILADLC